MCVMRDEHLADGTRHCHTPAVQRAAPGALLFDEKLLARNGRDPTIETDPCQRRRDKDFGAERAVLAHPCRQSDDGAPSTELTSGSFGSVEASSKTFCLPL